VGYFSERDSAGCSCMPLKIEHQLLCSPTGMPHSMQILILRTG
jgi:hypothetical protein